MLTKFVRSNAHITGIGNNSYGSSPRPVYTDPTMPSSSYHCHCVIVAEYGSSSRKQRSTTLQRWKPDALQQHSRSKERNGHRYLSHPDPMMTRVARLFLLDEGLQVPDLQILISTKTDARNLTSQMETQLGKCCGPRACSLARLCGTIDPSSTVETPRFRG